MNVFLLRRYFLFVVSLFINALGVAFITKALLGTSPITSITYVLSMFTPQTMGEWTIIVNILFVVFELFFITKSELKSNLRTFLLQIPISICFGWFIDVAMNLLFWLEPALYLQKIIALLIGCFILATGITLEVKANVAMTSGEYFVRVISLRFKKDFGYVKLGFDVTLVAIACLFSYLFMSDIRGVREGTVIAALLVGPIVHFLTPYYRFLDRWIREGRYAEANTQQETSPHIIITIAREFGSGGHALGEMLAKELGLKLYDKEFIHLAAQESGIDEEYIRKNEQSIPSFWLKCLLSHSSEVGLDHSYSKDDVLFLSESKIIQELARKESCIIIGRCADFVLRDYPQLIRIFCCTDLQSARNRCIEEYGISPESAESEIRRTNRSRIAHYEYYTGEKWGDPHRYNLMVNTGTVDLTTACRMIKDLYLDQQQRLEKATHTK